jgi:hypothetical protein
MQPCVRATERSAYDDDSAAEMLGDNKVKMNDIQGNSYVIS